MDLNASALHVALSSKLDQAVEVLQCNKQRWAELPVRKKIGLVDRMSQGVLEVAEGQVAKSAQAKGIVMGSPRVSEEWGLGPLITLRYLRLIRGSLRQISRYGAPQIPPDKVRTRADGQLIVEVFPGSTFDRLVYRARGEVWMQPGVTRHTLSENVASFYREAKPRGKVALLLGAGNVAALDLTDIAYELFVEGEVCLLKFNPVNDYLGPFVEKAYASLIAEGFLQLAHGGSDVGAYLCNHPGIEKVHITGNYKTHNTIVFGAGDEGAQRRRLNQPMLSKPITSELGNVGPVIVVPGAWSESDLRFQAENVVTQVENNAGFNCNAARVLVTHAGWRQRKAFVDSVREVLRSSPARRAYYPGAFERYQRIVAAHPEAEALGPREGGAVPWTLVADVDSSKSDDVCFTEESFCGVLAETSLEARDAAEFLEEAVEFCNETLFGSLNAGIILHPRTAAELGPALENAIAGLRYGTVGINYWPAIGYVLGSLTWGAFPGHTLDDVRSGSGFVLNAYMFDKPQKSVVYGPFRVRPKPPWFVTSKASKAVPKLSKFEANPRWSALPSLLMSAMGGG